MILGLLNSLSKSMSKDGVPAKADNNTLGHLVQMWKMLPAGYDLSKIPQEVGEYWDFKSNIRKTRID